MWEQLPLSELVTQIGLLKVHPTTKSGTGSHRVILDSQPVLEVGDHVVSLFIICCGTVVVTNMVADQRSLKGNGV